MKTLEQSIYDALPEGLNFGDVQRIAKALREYYAQRDREVTKSLGVWIDRMIWVTADREPLYIPGMSTEHLQNVLRRFTSSATPDNSLKPCFLTMRQELIKRGSNRHWWTYQNETASPCNCITCKDNDRYMQELREAIEAREKRPDPGLSDLENKLNALAIGELYAVPGKEQTYYRVPAGWVLSIFYSTGPVAVFIPDTRKQEK